MAKNIALTARAIEQVRACVQFAPDGANLRERCRFVFSIPLARDDGGGDEQQHYHAAVDAEGAGSSPVVRGGDGPLTDAERDALWSLLGKIYNAIVTREGIG